MLAFEHNLCIKDKHNFQQVNCPTFHPSLSQKQRKSEVVEDCLLSLELW